MNLITNRQLDRNEKQVIYELTLKKRQSKKSTMSDKQVAAREQLAKELKLVRIIPSLEENFYLEHEDSSPLLFTTNSNNTVPIPSSSSSSNTFIINSTNDDHKTIDTVDNDQPSTSGSIGTVTTSGISCCDSSTTSSSAIDCTTTITNNVHRETPTSISNSASSSSELNQKLLQYQNHINSPAASSCGCSFGRSDSSYSGSSQNSSGSARLTIDFSAKQEDELQALRKEANIKFYKSKLQHLNDELQKKLYEYEYLVTKEKALLGAYNMVLFTNEGVNNFY